MSTSFGQTFQKIRSLLHKGNFPAFKAYIDKADEAKDTSASWELLRSVVSDYQEGIIGIHEMDGSSGTRQYFLFTLKIIATKEKIIFYELKRGKAAYDQDYPSGAYENFKDDNGYRNFEAAFKNIYNASLNVNDLFQTEIVYGDNCGIGGVNPYYLDKLNALLLNNNIKKIREWLKSANLEKQLYAIRGYRYLEGKGYKMSDEEQKLLTLVKKKDGRVYTCRGCSYGHDDFQFIVSEILSRPIEQFKPEIDRKDQSDLMSDDISTNHKNKKSLTNHVISNDHGSFWTIIGMSALFLTSLFCFINYFNTRRKAKINNL